MRKHRIRNALAVLIALTLTAQLTVLQIDWHAMARATADALRAPATSANVPAASRSIQAVTADMPRPADRASSSPVGVLDARLGAVIRPADGTSSPTPSPTVTPTVTSTLTTTPTTTQTFTATPTASPTATTTWTVTSTPSATATGTATLSPTITPTLTPVVSYYFAEGYTGQVSTNGKAAFTETLNILNPGSSTAFVTITYYFEGGGTPQTVNRTISPASILRESVNTDVGQDKGVAAVVASPQRIYASRTITRVSGTGVHLDGSNAAGITVPSRTWAFPEGYVGITFQEYIVLFNPGTVASTATLQLAPQAASATGARSTTVTVPAMGRTTVNLRAFYNDPKVKAVAALVSSDQPLVAERVEYFGDGIGSGKAGTIVGSGAPPAGPQFRIPFGSSGGGSPSTGAVKFLAQGDQQYITLLNPPGSGSPVQVTATFADSSGKTLGTPLQVTVASGTRQTILANSVLGTSAVSAFSATISATGSILVEATQYYGGSPNVGSHPGVIVPAAAASISDAFLSELSTQLADGTSVNRQVFLYNPGPSPLQVNATYFGAGATTITTPTLTVTATGTPTSTVTATATATSTVTATATATATAQTVTGTPSPSATGTPTATLTSTPSATATLTLTATVTYTVTPTATATVVPIAYTVPAGGILAVNVNSGAGTTGPTGAEYKIAPGSSGTFVAYSVGTTSDGLFADEDSGVPAF